MLLPAGVLIVLLLAAVAVDRAIVFADQRELVATAQAAANDGAAVGADPRALRTGAPLRFDRQRVDAAIRDVVALAEDPEHPIELAWRLDGDEVVVTLRREVRHLYTQAVPGADDVTEVRAVARARLVDASPP